MAVPRPAGAILVTLCVGEPTLRSRIVAACAAAGIALADAEAGEAAGPADPADIVIADAPVETAAPVIALSPGARAWPCDLRAVVPPDLDGATLGAVIAVVAAGLAVMPREKSPAFPPADGPRRGAWAETPAGADGADAVLTPREREVLALLAAGASNKAIARALSVSVHTAKFHVASITEKLGAGGRLEAVAIGIRSGLVMV